MKSKSSEESRKKRLEKISKSTELISTISSGISNFNVGDIIRPTPLAKSVINKTGGHPHVDTVKAEFNRIGVAEDILRSTKPLKNEDEVYALQVLDTYEKELEDSQFKKEIRKNIADLRADLHELIIHIKNKK